MRNTLLNSLASMLLVTSIVQLSAQDAPMTQTVTPSVRAEIFGQATLFTRLFGLLAAGYGLHMFKNGIEHFAYPEHDTNQTVTTKSSNVWNATRFIAARTAALLEAGLGSALLAIGGMSIVNAEHAIGKTNTLLHPTT